jgi:hypothetical protein
MFEDEESQQPGQGEPQLDASPSGQADDLPPAAAIIQRHLAQMLPPPAAADLARAFDNQNNEKQAAVTEWQKFCLCAADIDDSGMPQLMEDFGLAALLAKEQRTLFAAARQLHKRGSISLHCPASTGGQVPPSAASCSQPAEAAAALSRTNRWAPGRLGPAVADACPHVRCSVSIGELATTRL